MHFEITKPLFTLNMQVAVVLKPTFTLEMNNISQFYCSIGSQNSPLSWPLNCQDLSSTKHLEDLRRSTISSSSHPCSTWTGSQARFGYRASHGQGSCPDCWSLLIGTWTGTEKSPESRGRRSGGSKSIWRCCSSDWRGYYLFYFFYYRKFPWDK